MAFIRLFTRFYMWDIDVHHTLDDALDTQAYCLDHNLDFTVVIVDQYSGKAVWANSMVDSASIEEKARFAMKKFHHLQK